MGTRGDDRLPSGPIARSPFAGPGCSWAPTPASARCSRLVSPHLLTGVPGGRNFHPPGPPNPINAQAIWSRADGPLRAPPGRSPFPAPEGDQVTGASGDDRLPVRSRRQISLRGARLLVGSDPGLRSVFPARISQKKRPRTLILGLAGRAASLRRIDATDPSVEL